MTGPIVVLRPEPGLTATLVDAFGRGLQARGMPLATVEARDWTAPATSLDALLIGSANAVRCGGRELEKVAHLPVLAVGKATAQAATDAGLAIERVGEGGLQELVSNLSAKPRHLLRLAGENHLPLSLPENIQVTTRISYAVKYSVPSAGQVSLLGGGAVVLLHSGEMAAHFSQQCEKLGIDKSRLTIAALAPRIARMAGDGWGAVHIAAARSDGALLDLTASLCNTPGMDDESARSGAARVSKNGSK